MAHKATDYQSYPNKVQAGLAHSRVRRWLRIMSFRLDPEVCVGLALLSEGQGRPPDELVNEAVREFVSKHTQGVEHSRGSYQVIDLARELVSERTQGVEVDLKSTLARLEAYRLRDPTGEKSMAAAMKVEAAIDYDPAEGVRVARSEVVGPASARMLDRLRG